MHSSQSTLCQTGRPGEAAEPEPEEEEDHIQSGVSEKNEERQGRSLEDVE